MVSAFVIEAIVKALASAFLSIAWGLQLWWYRDRLPIPTLTQSLVGCCTSIKEHGSECCSCRSTPTVVSRAGAGGGASQMERTAAGAADSSGIRRIGRVKYYAWLVGCTIATGNLVLSVDPHGGNGIYPLIVLRTWQTFSSGLVQVVFGVWLQHSIHRLYKRIIFSDSPEQPQPRRIAAPGPPGGGAVQAGQPQQQPNSQRGNSSSPPGNLTVAIGAAVAALSGGSGAAAAAAGGSASAHISSSGGVIGSPRTAGSGNGNGASVQDSSPPPSLNLTVYLALLTCVWGSLGTALTFVTDRHIYLDTAMAVTGLVLWFQYLIAVWFYFRIRRRMSDAARRYQRMMMAASANAATANPGPQTVVSSTGVGGQFGGASTLATPPGGAAAVVVSPITPGGVLITSVQVQPINTGGGGGGGGGGLLSRSAVPGGGVTQRTVIPPPPGAAITPAAPSHSDLRLVIASNPHMNRARTTVSRFARALWVVAIALALVSLVWVTTIDFNTDKTAPDLPTEYSIYPALIEVIGHVIGFAALYEGWSPRPRPLPSAAPQARPYIAMTQPAVTAGVAGSLYTKVQSHHPGGTGATTGVDSGRGGGGGRGRARDEPIATPPDDHHMIDTHAAAAAAVAASGGSGGADYPFGGVNASAAAAGDDHSPPPPSHPALPADADGLLTAPATGALHPRRAAALDAADDHASTAAMSYAVDSMQVTTTASTAMGGVSVISPAGPLPPNTTPQQSVIAAAARLPIYYQQQTRIDTGTGGTTATDPLLLHAPDTGLDSALSLWPQLASRSPPRPLPPVSLVSPPNAAPIQVTTASSS